MAADFVARHDGPVRRQQDEVPIEGRAELRQLDAATQVGGHRREEVPAVERVRDVRPPEPPLGQSHGPAEREMLQRSGEDAVIGSDEPRAGPLAATLGFDRHRAAVAADARVDHDEVNRVRRKRAHRVGQDGGAGDDVLRRDLVRDVDERRVRRDAENHALHLRNVTVGEAEVGGESDEGHGRRGVRCQSCAGFVVCKLRNAGKRNTGTLAAYPTIMLQLSRWRR